MRTRLVARVTGAALLITMTVTGCGRLTRENYEKIQSGMTLREVEAILGHASDKDGFSGAIGEFGGSAQIATWEEGDRHITVTFVNDEVVLKTMTGL